MPMYVHFALTQNTNVFSLRFSHAFTLNLMFGGGKVVFDSGLHYKTEK